MRALALAALFLLVVAGTAGIYLGLRSATTTHHHLACAPVAGAPVKGWVDPLAQKGCPQNP